MKSVFLISSIVLTSFQLCADISVKYYDLSGTITTAQGELLKNAELYLIQGNFKKITSTNDQGKFKLKVRYLKPCISGSGKRYTDERILKLAHEYNGDELLIYVPAHELKLKLKETWMDYYLDLKKGSELCELLVDLEDATLLENKDEHLETYLRKKQKLRDIRTFPDWNSNRSMIDCHRINQDIKFVVDKYDFTGEKLEFFLDIVQLNRDELIQSKTKPSIWFFKPCPQYSSTPSLIIQLAENGVIEEIRE